MKHKSQFHCFLLILTALQISQFSSLKFNKYHTDAGNKFHQNSAKKTEIEAIQQNEINNLFTPVPNFLEALVVNFKGKNFSSRTAQKILSPNHFHTNINGNAKTTSTSNSSFQTNSTPNTQTNLNSPNSSVKASKIKTNHKANSFIDIEEHHLLVENHYSSTIDEFNISPLDLNDFSDDDHEHEHVHVHDIEDLHLNSN